MRITIAFGTRPEIIKLAPVVAELRRRGHTVRAVATGQHTDEAMAGRFHADLGLEPDVTWALPSVEAERVGSLLAQSYAELAANATDVVMVLGDTHTVPALCLAAVRHAVPIVHLEAGLRSFNRRSIEEGNRKVAAALASVHLAPTQLAEQFLLAEGVAGDRIHVVGNPVIDTLDLIGVPKVPVARRSGVLVTAHRPGNVDDPARLQTLVTILTDLATAHGPVTFPVHPRTRDALTRAGALGALDDVTGLHLCEPLRYTDLLSALATTRLVVTDSGGLQEEAAYYGVPVIVLRPSTPRWEGVAAHTSELTGLDADRVRAAALRLSAPGIQDHIASMPCPYGDGKTAVRVADLLEDPEVLQRLVVEEPDFSAGAPFLDGMS